MEFVAGLVLGAILGVAADRLWSRYESIPRVQLTWSFFQNAQNEQGCAYEVKNLGNVELPDFDIVLFHPDRGSLRAFVTDDTGPLLPAQERKFRCTLIKDGRPCSFLRPWALSIPNQYASQEPLDGLVLRLVMKASDYVLFESSAIGNAVARSWARTLATGAAGRETWDEADALCTVPPRSLRQLMNRLTSKFRRHSRQEMSFSPVTEVHAQLKATSKGYRNGV